MSEQRECPSDHGHCAASVFSLVNGKPSAPLDIVPILPQGGVVSILNFDHSCPLSYRPNRLSTILAESCSVFLQDFFLMKKKSFSPVTCNHQSVIFIVTLDLFLSVLHICVC